MPVLIRTNHIWTFLVLSTLIGAGACLLHSDKVDFNTQVKPIINRKCISCHGGVRAKGGFSLLFQEEAFAPTESGKPAIIPGDPDHSEMIKRLTAKDPEERMPYKHEPLSADEISTLREWVKEGAPWGQHWAYIPVAAPSVPDNTDPWIKNNIDHYILEALDKEGLHPASEADKPTLLRRVSLDLIGMYPSGQLSAQYLNSTDLRAYEVLVDSLLASPSFGEKWASMWMDLARYADTKGYERDDSRNIWRYRDWLIKAFNQDMPYDRFLTEQIAGDLLPNPTDADYIATAFHRNTMTNDEGGTDNEEFRTAAVLDRVNTTWEALMGTTFACVQCHSHPYDPFHHDEYYKFMAYFNDTRDEDSQADYPLLRDFNDSSSMELKAVTDWVRKQAGDARARSVNELLRTWEPSINSLTADHFINGELSDTKWLAFRQNGSARLKSVDLQDRDELIYRYMNLDKGGTWLIHLDSVKGRVIATVKAGVTKDWTIEHIAIPATAGIHDIYLTYSNPHLKKPDQNGILYDWFCFTQQFPGKESPDYTVMYNRYWKLLTASISTTPVMMDNPGDMHRVSNVFERGNWLVKGDVVTPSVPASLSACMPKGAPANRLGLAMWMTSPKNPLVSRTMVNRLWEQLFGVGLAETLEDLGTQGSPPTHRELLDYLAYTFMYTDQWSIKKVLKEIVMSATYQEDSKVSPASLKKDPFDKLYSRGARVRLSAEQLRDQALCISNKMCSEMYGPSVFPYQPKGIWLSPWNGAQWVMSQGQEQYRRGVYTYWKRTASYPSMLTFDATSREVCTARRIRTNTPLQALVTLNDSAYLDLAHQFALRMQSLEPGNPSAQIGEGYKLMLFKPIAPEKLAVLLQLYQRALGDFEAHPEKVGDMLGRDSAAAAAAAPLAKSASTAAVAAPKPTAQLAALTVVAGAMLNLDEIVTKN
jgi:hypothetical protein